MSVLHECTPLPWYCTLDKPKSWTLELLSFDEYCRFDTSACASAIKRGSLYRTCASRNIKTAIFIVHRKLRVPTSEREGKLSNTYVRAARAMHGENLWKFAETRARGSRGKYAFMFFKSLSTYVEKTGPGNFLPYVNLVAMSQQKRLLT